MSKEINLSTETIVCQTCKKEKAISDFHCKGKGVHPALCVVCFRKKKSAYMKEYYRRPEVNKAKKEYEKVRAEIPAVNQRKRFYAKQYRKAAEWKDRRAEWMKGYLEQPGKRDLVRGYAKKSYKKPEVKEKKRIYQQKPEVKEKKRIYRQRPEAKERMYHINFRDRDNARDRYVKNLINQRTGGLLRAKDIPPELVEMQRQSLILKRTIKQKNKENEQHDTTTNI